MTDNQQNQKTYKQAASEYYNQKYEVWMPWIEDKYLSWFTKDNKASYATKGKTFFPPIHPILYLVFLSLMCSRAKRNGL
jgi:hypothetical protein